MLGPGLERKGSKAREDHGGEMYNQLSLQMLSEVSYREKAKSILSNKPSPIQPCDDEVYAQMQKNKNSNKSQSSPRGLR